MLVRRQRWNNSAGVGPGRVGVLIPRVRKQKAFLERCKDKGASLLPAFGPGIFQEVGHGQI